MKLNLEGFSVSSANVCTATGGFVGNVTGNVTTAAGLINPVQVVTATANGAIALKSGLVTLVHSSTAIAATLAAPVAGQELFIVNMSGSGTQSHTVTLASGVTFVGGSNNKLTLDAEGEAIHMIAVSATKWLILENIGTVTVGT
jgi:hypothetical protein